MRKFIGIALCLVAPAWVALSVLQEHLLRTGVLNTKNMPPFVGNEKGTVAEYFLNVWHWDAILLLLMLASLSCLIIGVLLLRRGRVSREYERVA